MSKRTGSASESYYFGIVAIGFLLIFKQKEIIVISRSRALPQHCVGGAFD